jgi:hypothetical protein
MTLFSRIFCDTVIEVIRRTCRFCHATQESRSTVPAVVWHNVYFWILKRGQELDACQLNDSGRSVKRGANGDMIISIDSINAKVLKHTTRGRNQIVTT